jgi:hypothetical protein
MSSITHKTAIKLDAIGATASIICAIHCAIFPFIVLFLTFYGLNFAAGPLMEFSLISTSVLIGLFTFTHGYLNHHKSLLPLSIFLIGLSIVFISHYMFHDVTHDGSISPEMIFSPVGAFLIGTAHYLNRKFSKKTSDKSCCK